MQLAGATLPMSRVSMLDRVRVGPRGDLVGVCRPCFRGSVLLAGPLTNKELIVAYCSGLLMLGGTRIRQPRGRVMLLIEGRCVAIHAVGSMKCAWWPVRLHVGLGDGGLLHS